MERQKVTKYNKLVRDRIPEIIESSGKSCTTEILSAEDYLRMIDAKLDEELAEYHKDQNIEELADLLEVIRAAAIARGYTIEELERVRAEKAAKRGGFEKRILLKTVVDPMEADSITDRICQNKAAILEKISVPMLEKYCWIEDNLYKCNVSTNTEYQRKFSHYYRMRFVSPQYREAFFVLFEEIKENPDISFEKVARQLYSVDQKHEFSFISKMLHTINTSRPIYDSQVNAALKLRTYQPDFEKRLKKDKEILDRISDQYASRGIAFHSVRQTDSKNSIFLRATDHLCGFLGRFMYALMNDAAIKEDKIADISHLSEYDITRKHLLSTMWFDLQEKHFVLYKKIYKVLIEQQGSYWSTMTFSYSDQIVAFYSFLRYIASYESYSEYKRARWKIIRSDIIPLAAMI